MGGGDGSDVCRILRSQFCFVGLSNDHIEVCRRSFTRPSKIQKATLYATYLRSSALLV